MVPEAGCLQGDGWVARQFFANTEFFADFGRYDVRLTVPSGFIVGATGAEQSRTAAGDRVTVSLRGRRRARLRVDDESELR